MAAKMDSCGPCKRDEDDNQAICWCSTCNEGLCNKCSKEHKKNKASTKHGVLPLDEIKKFGLPSILLEDVCENHKDKQLALYCQSHDQILCLACVPLFHRHCEEMIPVEDAAKNCKESLALFDLQSRAEDMKDVYDSMHKAKSNNIKQLDEQSNDIHKTISAQRQAFTTKLAETETIMKDKVYCKKEKLILEITAENSDIYQKKTQLESMIRDLANIKQLCSEQQVFVAIKRFDALQSKLEEEFEMSRSKLTKTYNLTHQLSQTPLLNMERLFGKVVTEESDLKVANLKKLKQPQINSQGSGDLKFVTKIFSGKYLYKICCFPLHNKAALSDTHNNCIYILDITSGNIHQMKLKTGFNPYYITEYDNDHALVAGIHQPLLKINILDFQVKEEINIYSRRNHYPMCVVGDYLVVCDYRVGFSVVKCKCLTKIPEEREVGYMCGWGRDKIIYTMYYMSALRAVTLQGQFLFECEVSDPMGVIVDKNNYIYASVRKSQIVRFTSAGKEDKTVLDLDDVPLGLAYNKATHEILITDFHSVKLYKII